MPLTFFKREFETKLCLAYLFLEEIIFNRERLMKENICFNVFIALSPRPCFLQKTDANYFGKILIFQLIPPGRQDSVLLVVIRELPFFVFLST